MATQQQQAAEDGVAAEQQDAIPVVTPIVLRPPDSVVNTVRVVRKRKRGFADYQCRHYSVTFLPNDYRVEIEINYGVPPQTKLIKWPEDCERVFVMNANGDTIDAFPSPDRLQMLNQHLAAGRAKARQQRQAQQTQGKGW